jgi:hypothetical protein
MLQTVNVPLIRALRALLQEGPLGLPYDAIFQRAGEVAPLGVPAGTESFIAGLLEAVAGGLVQIHAHRPRVVKTPGEKPIANGVARAAAKIGRTSVTSMLQRDWHVDAFDRRLLCLLDGTHNRRDLIQILTHQIHQEELHVVPNPEATAHGTQQYVSNRVESALAWMANAGILEA